MTAAVDPTRLPLVFDVDGTVCFDGHTISDDITSALVRCHHSHQLMFASARPMRDLLPVIPEPLHDATLIAGNGAQFRAAEGQTHTAGFSVEVRRQLDDLIDALGLTYFVDGPWDYSSTGDPDRPIFRQVDPAGLARAVPREELPSYIKAIVFTTEPDHIEALRGLPVTLHVHEAEGHVDLSPERVDKGTAILAAGLPERSYVAFGNDANDATMFRSSALSICVGEHPIGRHADHVISREQVAPTIRRLTS